MSQIKQAIAAAMLAGAIAFTTGAAAAQSHAPMALVGTGATVRIAKPGSYYLPHNLLSRLKNLPVVMVTASNVTLNLNGNAIIGPGGSGASVGINTAPNVTNVAVLNGTITNIAGTAIKLGADSEVAGVRIVNNGGDGVDCASGCLINGNIIAENTGTGLNFGADDTSGYENNVLNGNGGGIISGTNLGHNVIDGVATTP